MSKYLQLVTAAAFLLLAPLAQAGQLDWLLTYTSTTPGIDGSIILNTQDTLTTVTVNAGGGVFYTDTGYQVTSISGTTDGATITGLAAPQLFPPGCNLGTNCEYAFDNLVIPGPGLDAPGLGIYDSSGAFHNLFYAGLGSSGTGAGTDADCTSPTTCTNYSITFAMTTAPEPATLGLMALGLLGAGFARRRRAA